MRRHLLDLVVLFIVATGIAVAVIATVPHSRPIVIRAWVFAVGALSLGAALASLKLDIRPLRRGAFEHALEPQARPVAPPHELERVQREVEISIASAYDLHSRLLPHLREIAWARLERAGHEPGPQTLGRWWDLLRPDRPPPVDRFARGIDRRELRELVDEIERM